MLLDSGANLRGRLAEPEGLRVARLRPKFVREEPMHRCEKVLEFQVVETFYLFLLAFRSRD